jgi:hypothetical protein
MKYLLIITTLFALSLINLRGAEVSKTSKTWTYNKVVCEIDYLKISNNKASYTLEFGLRNQKDKDPQYYIGLSSPVPHSNFRRNGFISLTLNKIMHRNLEPESLEKWEKDDKAGVTALFNFDGIGLKVNFYMKDDSPILWSQVSVVNPNKRPVKQIQIKLIASPGHVTKFEGKYHRVATTNTREMKTDKNYQHFKLAKDEIFVFMSDEKYDAATNKKSVGPCFVILGKNEALKKTRVTVGQLYAVEINLDFKVSLDEFKFGIWESSIPQPNAKVLEMLKKELPVYEKELNSK